MEEKNEKNKELGILGTCAGFGMGKVCRVVEVKLKMTLGGVVGL